MEVPPDDSYENPPNYSDFDEFATVWSADFLRVELSAVHTNSIGAEPLCSTCNENTSSRSGGGGRGAIVVTAMPLELESTRSFLRALQAAYAPLHGPASIAICTLSMLVNAAIVVVLTRRHMITPSNTLLTAIACVDILKMLFYTAFAARFSLSGQPLNATSDFPVGWIVFLVLQSNAGLVLHGVQTWTNVLLAWLRLVMVSSVRGRHLVSVRTSRLAVLVLVVANLLVYTPNYLVRIELRVNGTCDSEEEPHAGLPHYDVDPLLENASVSSATTSHKGLTIQNQTSTVADSPADNAGRQGERVVAGGDHNSTVQWPRFWWFCPLDPAFGLLASLIHGPILKLLASVLISLATALLIVKLQQAAARRRRLKAGQAATAHSERKPSLIQQLHSRFMSSISRRLSAQNSVAGIGAAPSTMAATRDRSTKSLLIYIHRQSWVSDGEESGPSEASLKLKRPSLKARQMEHNSSTTWMLVAVRPLRVFIF